MAKAEIITPPPPHLKDKVGPRGHAFDAEAIVRAENALKAMSGNFQDWMAADIVRLDTARLAARADGWSETSSEDLFARAHDVKGLGATYDYPLCTAIAGALCRLLETPAARAEAHRHAGLIDAHVDALRAIVRDRVRSVDDPTGKALAQVLRQRVDALMGPE